jgi:hypothetical protein
MRASVKMQQKKMEAYPIFFVSKKNRAQPELF